jgi:hypothetical protein
MEDRPNRRLANQSHARGDGHMPFERQVVRHFAIAVGETTVPGVVTTSTGKERAHSPQRKFMEDESGIDRHGRKSLDHSLGFRNVATGATLKKRLDEHGHGRPTCAHISTLDNPIHVSACEVDGTIQIAESRFLPGDFDINKADVLRR